MPRSKPGQTHWCILTEEQETLQEVHMDQEPQLKSTLNVVLVSDLRILFHKPGHPAMLQLWDCSEACFFLRASSSPRHLGLYATSWRALPCLRTSLCLQVLKRLAVPPPQLLVHSLLQFNSFSLVHFFRNTFHAPHLDHWARRFFAQQYLT